MGQGVVGIDPLLCSEGISLQPLHEGFVQSSAGVDVLRGVDVEIGESWQEEGPGRQVDPDRVGREDLRGRGVRDGLKMRDVAMRVDRCATRGMSGCTVRQRADLD